MSTTGRVTAYGRNFREKWHTSAVPMFCRRLETRMRIRNRLINLKCESKRPHNFSIGQ